MFRALNMLMLNAVTNCGRRVVGFRHAAARAAAIPATLGREGLRLQDIVVDINDERSAAVHERGAGEPGTSGQDLPSWPHSSRYFQGCEPSGKPLTVAVLLSGGVDSSLALALLRAAGHNVHAFYLQIWFQEDFRNFWDQCPWEEDLEFATQVCKQQGVQLETVPLTTEYWDRVVSHCVSEIRAGRTPNPDVLCNSRVKFGAFYDYLETHHAGKFDRIASGHYARIDRLPDGRPELRLTPDEVKDQTYFLAHLTSQQLARVMFPLGHLTKREVRQLAMAAGLANMNRKDSQGICFLGKVKFSEFVKEHLGVWPGPVIEEESNEVVAQHDGFWFYTIGQRSGLNVGELPNGPWYVVRKNPDMNAIYVSRDYFSQDNQKARNSIICGSFNWINGWPQGLDRSEDDAEAADGDKLFVKVRHGARMYECKVFRTINDGASAHVVLSGSDQGLAPGQYAVFYRGGVCLGSAVMQNSVEDSTTI